MSYIRLKRGNDWGVQYWAIAPLGSNGCSNSSRGIRTVDGEMVPVRFADGAEGFGVIRLVRHSFTVGDMGHNYSGWYWEPDIELTVNGSAVRVSMGDLDVCETWAIEHTSLEYHP